MSESSCSIGKLERIIRALAGTFVTVSLALGYWVSPWWFLFTLFVGLNLLQSAFTRWCLAEEIVKKLGIAGESTKQKTKI